MDVNWLGRIHDRGGWKAKGRAHGQTSGRSTPVSVTTTSTVIDDHPDWPTPRS
jgi:hypothetical protein